MESKSGIKPTPKNLTRLTLRMSLKSSAFPFPVVFSRRGSNPSPFSAVVDDDAELLLPEAVLLTFEKSFFVFFQLQTI